ncbi:TIGR01458 family HAD-type hydrolase [Photobacterium sp. SDRW27]|uniref:TIGR01458 family HAD-type hydrolase n=1 Tax=Photobacterium obscurum TaxID=2829490 RepID=UPI002243DEB3|nr:TIGR01458 family HAD-type hydrolase [Photobacterium obscurum]MCW8329056.1 TIGR01458 family HAD-type hydrolase [Photobacterium obscurum]
MYKALFFDLSGVLYDGTQAIPGAVEAIAQAQASDLEIRFVTNTSRKTCAQIYHDLTQLGFKIHLRQIYTAPAAVKALVKQRQWRPYCLLHQNIRSEFSDIDQSQPNAVLIADAEEGFCYRALDFAFQLCQSGAPLIGIGRNRYFKLGGQLHLDAGPFIQAIEYAAATEAIIVGKPSVEFFAQVVASTAAPAEETLMVGDDVFGDVEGALNAGLQACLVKTGKYQPGDEHLVDKPFRCVDSVVEAVDIALSGQN